MGPGLLTVCVGIIKIRKISEQMKKNDQKMIDILNKFKTEEVQNEH